jgi:hypothetical protein
MKKWNDLTPGEREKVIERETNSTLQAIAEAGGNLFPELEAEIEAAWKIAERNRTPWFFAPILYQDIPGAKEKIDAITLNFCESALYAEAGEHFINL